MKSLKAQRSQNFRPKIQIISYQMRLILNTIISLMFAKKQADEIQQKNHQPVEDRQINQLKNQLLVCQTYDSDYENKKVLNGYQAYAIFLKNQYHPATNPGGMINFAVSINAIMPAITTQYLPDFLTPKDCAYPDALGFDPELNPILSQDTGFKPDETFSYNNIESIASVLSYHQKQVCFVGQASDFDEEAVLSNSRASRCDLPQAELVVVLFPSKEEIRQVQESHKAKMRLYILASKQELQNIEKAGENQAFAYLFGLRSEIQLCVAHSSDPKIINMIKCDWNFFHTSNITKRASLTSNLQIKIGNSETGPIRKMIYIDSEVQVEQKNIWLVGGAGGGINHLSRALFNGGNLWTESPYYMGFDFYFFHSGVRIKNLSKFQQSKTINNIKVAYDKGGVGYMVCNPNNPMGTRLTPEEVVQICEWAQDKPDFHLIFDEAYLNVCREGKTMSAASYAIKSPNIHVVRSMAKDFGLNGFKIGIVISSNPIVMQKFSSWRKIISHHPFTISVINEMLLASNYGQNILKHSKVLLKQQFNQIFKDFEAADIKFIKPEAGYFFFADLREYLRESSKEAEESLWKKFFYKYRVSISCGLDFHASEPGYFRICPTTDFQVLKEAIKRMKVGLLQK